MPVVVLRQAPWENRLSPGPSSCISLRWLLGKFPAFLARVVHTWIFGALFRRGLVSGSLVGVARAVQMLDFSGDAAFLWAQCLARQ